MDINILINQARKVSTITPKDDKKPQIVECKHNIKRKYRLVYRAKITQELIYKLICGNCVKKDLENGRVFVGLH